MTAEFQFGLSQTITALGVSLARTHEHYAERLTLLRTCWKEANATSEEAAEEHQEDHEGEDHSDAAQAASPKGHQDGTSPKGHQDGTTMEKGEQADQDCHQQWKQNSNMDIPKTFAAMARPLTLADIDVQRGQMRPVQQGTCAARTAAPVGATRLHTTADNCMSLQITG
ncbi:unnamed protein product [Symbiodinium sp. KB8]|nr:unnamed protein product [Symbiodinium sp. KB8]